MISYQIQCKQQAFLGVEQLSEVDPLLWNNNNNISYNNNCYCNTNFSRKYRTRQLTASFWNEGIKKGFNSHWKLIDFNTFCQLLPHPLHFALTRAWIMNNSSCCCFFFCQKWDCWKWHPNVSHFSKVIKMI